MKVFLIRHGETVDNVAGNLAGVTDSALTNHGVLQIARLGQHLASEHAPFAAIFTSDLQRARKTGQAILDASKNQPTTSHKESVFSLDAITELKVLREQDFGSLEGKPWAPNRNSDTSRPTPLVPPETKASLDARAKAFIDDYLIPLLVVEGDCKAVVVSHGLLLSRLWKCLLARSSPSKVRLADNIVIGPRGLEHLGAWANTGILELDITYSQADSEKDVQTEYGRDDGTDRSRLPEDRSGNSQLESVTDQAARPAHHDSSEPRGQTTGDAPAQLDEHKYPRFSIYIKAVNSTQHLAALKRTRGVGSAAHDERQQKISTFFKRPRLQ